MQFGDVMNGFDTRELTAFQKELLKLAKQTMPNESAKFMRAQGDKLQRKTLACAKSRMKEKTGILFKSIRRGKVYTYKGNGGTSVRVYSKKPAYHMNLLEYGHRIVTKDGRELGFVEGKFFFRDAAKAFELKHYSDTQNFIDKVLEEGLS